MIVYCRNNKCQYWRKSESGKKVKDGYCTKDRLFMEDACCSVAIDDAVKEIVRKEHEAGYTSGKQEVDGEG